MENLIKGIADIFKEELKIDNPKNEGKYNQVFYYHKYDFFFLFGLIKLLDCAQEYSKSEVINEYKKYGMIKGIDEILNEKSVFPNGDKLGFVNFSDFDLNSLVNDEYNLFENFQDYLLKFDNNIIEVLSTSNIDWIFSHLLNEKLLFNYLKKLNNIKLDKDFFVSHNNFCNAYNDFLLEYDKFFGFNVIEIGGEINERPENKLIVDYLFTNLDISNKSEIKMYDPSCGDGNLLCLAKSYIGNINSDCKIEWYGKELVHLPYAQSLFRMIINYQPINNIKYLSNYNEQFKFMFDEKFDVILSDFRHVEEFINSLDSDLDISNYIENYFVDSLNSTGKLVLTLSEKTIDKLMGKLANIVKMDYLEALIQVIVYGSETFYYLIINKNKSDLRKDCFMVVTGKNLMAYFTDEELYELNFEFPPDKRGNLFNYPGSFKKLINMFNDQKAIYRNFINKDASFIIPNECYNPTFRFNDYILPGFSMSGEFTPDFDESHREIEFNKNLDILVERLKNSDNFLQPSSDEANKIINNIKWVFKDGNRYDDNSLEFMRDILRYNIENNEYFDLDYPWENILIKSDKNSVIVHFNLNNEEKMFDILIFEDIYTIFDLIRDINDIIVEKEYLNYIKRFEGLKFVKEGIYRMQLR